MSKVNTPTLVAVGVPGGGKSTIMKHISPNSVNFHISDSSQSNTFDYADEICYLKDNRKLSRVRLYDTVGLCESHKIVPNLLTGLSRFLQQFKDGITILLFVIPVVDERFNVEVFRRILSIFGRRITFTNNMAIVYTQSSRLNEKERIKTINKYKSETASILQYHGIRVDNIPQIDFDDDRDQFVDIICGIVQDNIKTPFMPEITSQLLMLKNRDPDIEDDEALVKVSQNNPEMSELVRIITEDSKVILEESKAMSDMNPNDQEERNRYLQNERDYNVLTRYQRTSFRRKLGITVGVVAITFLIWWISSKYY